MDLPRLASPVAGAAGAAAGCAGAGRVRCRQRAGDESERCCVPERDSPTPHSASPPTYKTAPNLTDSPGQMPQSPPAMIALIQRVTRAEVRVGAERRRRHRHRVCSRSSASRAAIPRRRPSDCSSACSATASSPTRDGRMNLSLREHRRRPAAGAAVHARGRHPQGHPRRLQHGGRAGRGAAPVRLPARARTRCLCPLFPLVYLAPTCRCPW